jgi:hypothetical protein
VTSFSDDFSRSDSTNLGAGWVEVSGDWSIISNQLSPGTTGGTVIVRAASAMASNDNFAQVTIAATTAVSHGVWCRGDTTLNNGYAVRNNGSSWGLFSVVSGAFTSIGSYAAAAAPGDVVKIQAVGSTIKVFVNGVQRISVTDTAVTTGTYVGVRSEANTGLAFDNFSAADVVAGATLSIAAETSSAQTLAGAKTASLTVPAEQDAAQALTGAKTAALTVAGVVESAQLLTANKTAALVPAVEQSTAQALSGTVTATLSAAVAVETPLPLADAKTAALTPAVEEAAVQALAGTKTATLTPAIEADAAQVLTAAETQTGTLTTAATVETAMPLVGVKTAVLVPALEDDAAHPLSRMSALVPSRERTYKIPAERRRLVVAAEHRTLKVRR